MENQNPGLKNKYSLWLLGISSAILLFGALFLFFSPFFGKIILGMPLFIFGFLMFYHGLRSPESDPTRKIWLLTCFGRQTDVMVEGLTFVCDWLPISIVGYAEVDMKKENHDFKLLKPILCKKSVNGTLVHDGYVTGVISTTMEADDSSAETLWDFHNAGGMEGIKLILDGMLTAQVEKIAAEKENEWMETHGEELTKPLLEEIEGLGSDVTSGDNDASDDARGLGIRFKKFNPIFRPIDKVIDARNDKLVEEAQRVSYMADTEATNAQIISRLKISHQGVTENGVKVIAKDTKVLTVAQAQDQIAMEKAQKDKDYKRVDNRNGLNVLDVT